MHLIGTGTKSLKSTDIPLNLVVAIFFKLRKNKLLLITKNDVDSNKFSYKNFNNTYLIASLFSVCQSTE